MGPYCISPPQTGALFHDFLPNFLLELLKDVDLQPRILLWSVHDGDAPHFLLSVRKFLSNVCQDNGEDKEDQLHGVLLPLVFSP